MSCTLTDSKKDARNFVHLLLFILQFYREIADAVGDKLKTVCKIFGIVFGNVAMLEVIVPRPSVTARRVKINKMRRSEHISETTKETHLDFVLPCNKVAFIKTK